MTSSSRTLSTIVRYPGPSLSSLGSSMPTGYLSTFAASNATAHSAQRALRHALERFPFRVRAIQVDGGSEFMNVFEDACKELGLALFVLPPHSPKLNGRVERANRTTREECHDCSTSPPTIAGLRGDLARYDHIYNTIRPHQALGLITPRRAMRDFFALHPSHPNLKDVS